MKFTIILFFLILSNLFCHAGFFEPVPKEYTISSSIQWDNDAFIYNPTDRYYTNGLIIGITLNGTDIHQKNDDLLFTYNLGFRLGQKIFTPSDIKLKTSEIDEEDYPYSGWLFFSVFQEKFSLVKAYYQYQYTIGFTGSWSLAEETQEFIHSIIDDNYAQGWDNQIEDDLGVGYSFKYTREYSGSDSPDIQFLNIAFLPYFKFNVGNIFTDASIGGELKFGKYQSVYLKKFNKNKTKKNSEYIEIINDSEQAEQNENASETSSTDFFLFGGAEFKFVVYNALLEGSLFIKNSPHTVDINRYMLETRLGIQINLNKWSFSYAHVWQSSEIEQDKWIFPNHQYGEIIIIYYW